jgi:hypothetical protein
LNEGKVGGTFSLTSDGKQPNIDGFALEAWGQAANFRLHEVRFFGEESALPPAYLRAFLGKCVFISEKKNYAVDCYPMLKLHDSGVLIVAFRVIGPDRPVELQEFIAEDVNLFQHEFDRVEVSPSLALLATRAYYDYIKTDWRLLHRVYLSVLEWIHGRGVQERTRIDEVDHFPFKLSPLTQARDRAGKETLSSLALTIFSTVGFVITRPHKGLRFIASSQKPLIQLGDFWTGRPHVHLARYDDQMETAPDNETRHRESFARIMMRACAREGERPASLPPNSRAFGDYGAYISSAITLWVWSARGLQDRASWADPNRGHLIYANQATAEVLEYGYMLHRSLLEHATSIFAPETVLELRRHLAILKVRMREASYYGEIRDLLQRGWKEMGIEDLREAVSDSLSIRESETRLLESRITGRLGRALTILFGLIVVPSLAKDVIEPTWRMFGIWRPKDADAVQLIAVAIALVLVLSALRTILKRTPRVGSR